MLNSLKNGDNIDYIVRELINKLNSIIESEVKMTNDRIKTTFSQNLNVFNSIISKSQDNFKNIKIEVVKENDVTRDDFIDSSNMVKSLNLSTGFVIPTIPIDPEIIVVEALKGIISEILKAINNKAYEEKKRQQLLEKISEENGAIREQIQESIGKLYEINNKIRTYTAKLEQEFKEKSSKVIDDSFKPIFEEVEEVFNIKKSKQSLMNKMIYRIKEIQGDIQEIDINLI